MLAMIQLYCNVMSDLEYCACDIQQPCVPYFEWFISSN